MTAAESGVGIWTEHKTSEGRIYWHCRKTGKSTWDKPEELKTTAEKLLSSTPWKEYSASDGRKYWYNKGTNQSVWQMPPEVKRLHDVTEEWPVFDDKDLAREKLKVLFEQRGITPKMKWDEGVKNIQADPRYSCFEILVLGEKKQVYSEYISQVQRKLKEEQRSHRIKAREAIVEELSTWDDLKPNTTYGEFAEKFHKTWWWPYIDEREKDEQFQEFMEEFERNFRSRRRERRKHLTDIMNQKFTTTDGITYTSSWQHVKELLKDDEIMKELDTLDLLEGWEEFARSTEKAEKRNLERKIYRIERSKRDALLQTFKDAVELGALSLDTDWVGFLVSEKLTENSSYQDVLGRVGSTPRELFEAVKDDLYDKYNRLKTEVKTIMRDNAMEILPGESNFEGFLNDLKKVETSEFHNDEENLRKIFDHLMRKAIRHSRKKNRSPPPRGDTQEEGEEEEEEGEQRSESGEITKKRRKGKKRRRADEEYDDRGDRYGDSGRHHRRHRHHTNSIEDGSTDHKDGSRKRRRRRSRSLSDSEDSYGSHRKRGRIDE